MFSKTLYLSESVFFVFSSLWVGGAPTLPFYEEVNIEA
jgi:hypothetical protein